LSGIYTMKAKPEVHIVVDGDGLKSIQIIGTPEAQILGHHLYLTIQNLLPNLDKDIQKALKRNKIGDFRTNGEIYYS